jgi:enoyl-CoA hydratase
MGYETIRVETLDRAGLITLHRPEALNALNSAMAAELDLALAAFDADQAIEASADIKEMSSLE